MCSDARSPSVCPFGSGLLDGRVQPPLDKSATEQSISSPKGARTSGPPLETVPPETLSRLADCLHDASHPQDALRKHLQVVFELASPRAAFVSLYEPERNLLVVAEQRGRSVPEIAAVVPGEGPGGRAFVSGEVVRDQSLIAVPLHARDRILGLLTLVGPRTDAADAVWLAIGRHLAAALHQAETQHAGLRRTRDLETAVSGLRSLERDRDELLGNVSHELKNPLTTIKAYLAMVRRERLGPLTDKQREAVDVCDRNADRLLRLINDMLLTSRLHAGRMTLDQKPFGLRGLVDEVVRTLGPIADDAKVTVQIARSGELFVKGDRDRMREVLANLVENAILFNRPGGRVEIALAADSGVASLSVRDTGPGIDAEDLPRIFDRFYRGRSALERRTGSGLGLAICRQIVHLHGGSIDARSVPGEGSIFTVRLPLFAGAVVSAGAPEETAQVAGSGILLVEDDDDCRDVLQQLLESDGFGVVSANTLDEALRTLGAMTPGLVLLDLRLGGSDGRKVLQHIRAEPRLKETPVFVISGAVESAAGFNWDGDERIDGFFEKPLNLQRLMGHIHALLRPEKDDVQT